MCWKWLFACRRLQHDLEVQAQQSQRRLEADVAAATAAGQAAVGEAVRTHNMALAAVKAGSECEAAALKAELAAGRESAAAAEGKCIDMAQSSAETELARRQLQQQLEQARRQLEARTLQAHASAMHCQA